MQEVTEAMPLKHENLIDFGISNDINLSQLKKQCQTSHYQKTALSTFIAGCTGTLRNNLHFKGPASLEDATAYVNEFDNFEKLEESFEKNQT